MSDVDDGLDLVVETMSGQRRPGQHQMAQSVAGALSSEHHAFIQAGTGTGKSFGYLVPAALAAVNDGIHTVVATATLALQRQLIERDLPRVAQALQPMLHRPLTYAVLKGRNNYVCLNKLHGQIPDDVPEELFATAKSVLAEQAAAVRQWAEQTQTGDRDEYPDEIDARVWRGFSVGRRECVGETKCAYGQECFTALRRQEAAEADIVVTNHAMLAIDAIEGIPVLPEHQAVIVDEGHELADRAAAAVTGELTLAIVERAFSRARRLVSQPAADRLDDAFADFEEALTQVASSASGPIQLVELPKNLLLALTVVRDGCSAVLSELAADRDSDPAALAGKQIAKGAVEDVHDVAGSMLAAGAKDVVWMDPGESRSPALRIAPLSVAGLLRETLFARTPVVLTSATLASGGGFGPLITSMGIGPEDVQCTDVGSPFDYAKQGILYVARHVPPPGRDGTAMEGLDELAELIEAAGGRTLALFSSWRAVERAAEYLRVRLDIKQYPLLVQHRGDSVAILVDKFTADESSVLLGTVSLWQGVDVPGRACTLVVIDRIPFPRPDDPLISARQRAVDQAGGSGFASVSVPRAGLLLAQGAGRLIRGDDDRGVVAVLDSRLATAGYGRTLRAGMPPLWYTEDKSTVLASLSRLRDRLGDQ